MVSAPAASTGLSREQAVPSRARIKLPPWLEVAKPRLIPLLLATTLGGMALSEGWPLPPLRLACTLGGGAMAAAAAGVLNCLWEQELDGRMQRTSSRALPSGRLSVSTAFAIAVALALTAATLLVGGVNCLAASLALLGLCSYVLLYTVLLKPRTPQNIVIGGASGAMPPVLGWTAVANEVTAPAIVLFLIIFVWTPPHFWALALYRIEDYRRSGLPMLPITHGPEFTRLNVLLYTILLVAVSLMPVMIRMSGLFYLFSALALGLVFLYYAWRLWRSYSDALARKTFSYSIFYLAALFGALLVDHYLG